MKNLIALFIFILSSIHLSAQDQRQAVQDLQNINDTVLNFISVWWKTPYRYGGSTKKGIDCSAFTQKFFKSVYEKNIPRVASQQYKSGIPIKKTEVKTGDLVFFRTKVKSTWHVGVYLTAGWFVHSSSGKGVNISNLNEARYKQIYYGSRRLL